MEKVKLSNGLVLAKSEKPNEEGYWFYVIDNDISPGFIFEDDELHVMKIEFTTVYDEIELMLLDDFIADNDIDMWLGYIPMSLK